jgi:hypothetical protein
MGLKGFPILFAKPSTVKIGKWQMVIRGRKTKNESVVLVKPGLTAASDCDRD